MISLPETTLVLSPICSRRIPSCIIVRLSEPLKRQYALVTGGFESDGPLIHLCLSQDHNLDLNELLGTSAYKERYRSDMIRWGEDQRERDPGFFARLATATSHAESARVWIVSDARRPTDVAYFQSNYGDRVTTVRVQASEECRATRGWVFTDGVDNAVSECGLDDLTHDLTVVNNSLAGCDASLEETLKRIVDLTQA